MGIEDRIERLEDAFGGNEQDKEIITFNYMVSIAIHKGLLSSEMRTLQKPWPKSYSDKLTPQAEKEITQLIQELGGGKQELKDLWKKYSNGLDWPFEKND